MRRREFNGLLGALAMAPTMNATAAFAQEPRRWSIRADLAECCSCDIPCSCNFGRPERICHGTRLYQIREGQFEGDDLAGINFVVTFDRTNWTRIYIDDRLGSAQLAIVDRLLPVAFGSFDRLARAKEHVSLVVGDGGDTFRFAVPESTVEMRLLPGLDGSPITISGLPNPAYYEYVQYESTIHEHASADGSWSHSGSNGFRSTVRVAG
jgi:hypothetical protein